jgi:hypothetical protein
MVSKEEEKDPDGSDRAVMLGNIPDISLEGQRKITKNISQDSDKSWSSLQISYDPPDTPSLPGPNIFLANVIMDVVCTEIKALLDVTPCCLVGNVKICFIHHQPGRGRGFLRNVHNLPTKLRNCHV